MRYLIKYTKENEIKFVSHLDLMRTIQRNIRRSELPVEYSKGFNPHILLSIAQPLSVGMHSTGEYLDLVFAKEVPEEEVLESLNRVSPNGIKYLDAAKVRVESGKKSPQAMALIDAAKYTIRVKCTDTTGVLECIQELENSDNWEILKKSKKTEKVVDIKKMVKEFKYWIKEDYLVVNALVSCGSKENLSANLLAEYLKKNCNLLDSERFVDIRREEMYAFKNRKLVPLHKYFR